MNDLPNTPVPPASSGGGDASKERLPVGVSASPNKEGGSISLGGSEGQVEAPFIRPATPEIQIPQEVESAGVKPQGQAKIREDVKKFGVQDSGEALPHPVVPGPQFPIRDQELVKTPHDTGSSKSWLIIWCLRQLEMAHLTLKNIGGKIIRTKNK